MLYTHYFPEIVSEQALDFFHLASQNFLQATKAVKVTRRFYRLAGYTFCLEFAGNAMIKNLTLALSHVEIEPLDDYDMTICLWDSASTGVPSLEFPWHSHEVSLRGEVIGYNSERIHTVLDIHTKVLHVFDCKSQTALYWISDAEKLPWWISGSPLQLIVHWWMQLKGLQLTHAAVVGYPHGGLLLAGKGGSGKSTTALACMKAGMQYLSEDYCLVSDLPEIRAYSVYNSAKISTNTLSWFPELTPYIENPHREKEDKAFLYYHRFQPEKILLECPLKAVLTLKIEKADKSRLEPLDPAKALTALSVSTLWQLTHSGLTSLNHLKRVTENLPCYQLYLGHDFMQVPSLLRSLL